MRVLYANIVNGGGLETSIQWNHHNHTRYFCGGYIEDFKLANDKISDSDVAQFDGNFVFITLTKTTLTYYSDVFSTKTVFYYTDELEVVISTSIESLDNRAYKKLPGGYKLEVTLSTGTVSTARYVSLKTNSEEVSIEQAHSIIDDITYKLPTDRIALSLSEGFDSGVLCASLTHHKKQFTGISINLLSANDILNSRHDKILSGVIISPTLADDYRIYEKYSKDVCDLNLIDSYSPSLLKTWGFKGACMIFEECVKKELHTCVTGIAGDAVSLPNATLFYNHIESRKLPYPYNQALDIQNTCIKSERVAALFNIELIHPFLFKRLWTAMNSIKSIDEKEYKAVFASYLKKHNFPYRVDETISTKVGLERCRLGSFL